MAYSELIKRFDRVRDYMRDFFIYGYKTRADFDAKSARTYDNERRRIESLAGEHMRFETGKNGKTAFFSLDASRLSENPFHAAWQSKSFTDNDIKLHFFILDVLAGGKALSAEEATDAISRRFGEVFDPQTVRNKLREYDVMHLVRSRREGRSVLYAQAPDAAGNLLGGIPNAGALLSFFTGAAPVGVIGSYIMNRHGLRNEHFLFKHRFVVQTLDDGVLLAVLMAIREQRCIRFTNVSGRDRRTLEVHGLPVKVLVSAQTGRQYLILERGGKFRYPSYRLDYIQEIRLLEPAEDGAMKQRAFDELCRTAWGLAHHFPKQPERVELTVAVDEEREYFILNRLEREKRCGTVERISPGVWKYSALVNDTNEMLPWFKSFTGRVLSLEGDNAEAIGRFYDDLRRMAELYAAGSDA